MKTPTMIRKQSVQLQRVWRWAGSLEATQNGMGPCHLLLVIAITCSPLWAFEVTKNVNSGMPPVERVVLFEKGQPTDHLSLGFSENAQTVFAEDGTIESRIVGQGEVKIMLHWKPRGNLRESIDISQYGSLLVTCRLEGNIKTTNPNGQVVESRPGNLWFPLVLTNAAGEQVGSANLADVTADGNTPAQTTTLRIPMVMFTYWGHDTHEIKGVGFFWDRTKPTVNRQFRLVIEKISLAD